MGISETRTGNRVRPPKRGREYSPASGFMPRHIHLDFHAVPTPTSSIAAAAGWKRARRVASALEQLHFLLGLAKEDSQMHREPSSVVRPLPPGLLGPGRQRQGISLLFFSGVLERCGIGY